MIKRCRHFRRLLFEQRFGQIFSQDFVCQSQDDGVFNGVLQFANIARPT